MCDLARKYLLEEPVGDHARIARALWTPIFDASAVKPTIGLFEIGMKTALIIFVTILTFSLTSLRESMV
jgi:hypothetical protein